MAEGETCPGEVVKQALAVIDAEPLARVEYLEVVDAEALQPVIEIEGPVMIAGAIWVGNTRLIDNGDRGPGAGGTLGAVESRPSSIREVVEHDHGRWVAALLVIRGNRMGNHRRSLGAPSGQFVFVPTFETRNGYSVVRAAEANGSLLLHLVLNAAREDGHFAVDYLRGTPSHRRGYRIDRTLS